MEPKRRPFRLPPLPSPRGAAEDVRGAGSPGRADEKPAGGARASRCRIGRSPPMKWGWGEGAAEKETRDTDVEAERQRARGQKGGYRDMERR